MMILNSDRTFGSCVMILMELHLGVVEQVITTMLRRGEVTTTMRSEAVRMCIS
jgi:hypothetical protein